MLTIYRASAGSGKTFKLTGEYLKLLFRNPAGYKHILAVTFTNKATDEMKQRIISELDILAHEHGKSDYTQILIKEAQIREDDIQPLAEKILSSILHDYTSFQISTIDRFFQQTMRAFTREIGLQGGYSVELDTEKVLSESVDKMLSELDVAPKQLLEWLLRFSEEKVETGKSWNIRNDIKSLSQEIFKESYKVYSDLIQEYISDKDRLDAYMKKLAIIRREFEATLKETAEKALAIIQRNGLTITDFKGGMRSPFAVFNKWIAGEIKEPSNTFISLADTPDNWVTQKASGEIRASVEQAFHNGLNDCVKEAIDLFGAPLSDYLTAQEISRYFYNLGILGDIDKYIRQYAAENNIMLISDTTQLLNLIIGDTDAPFIYEKTGTRIHHYMIDEFQDTSGMQWRNFYPLLKDSLSAGNFNLIVGDVKQSIYRWRNSDWNLLETQVRNDFVHERVNEEVLKVNYRSCRNIVEFNNAFFTLSAHVLQQKLNQDSPSDAFASKIEQVYAQTYQQVQPEKEEKRGEVCIEFFDDEDNDSGLPWKDKVLDKLPTYLEQLQDKGFRLKDMAVLVRTKNEGAAVADKLLEYAANSNNSRYQYDVISDEALFIGKSQSVKLLISLLRYLVRPEENINRALIAYGYSSIQKEKSTGNFTSYFQFNKNNVERKLPLHDSLLKKLEEIKQLSLYEITENLIELFLVPENSQIGGETVFIQAFQDMVLEFASKNTSDVSAFLSWWDENGCRKTISMPDSQDAVRILTIHKSKGLGFKAVIMPFCDWEIDHKAILPTILWLQAKKPPFSDMPLLPVRYSKKLQQTIFADDYLNEKLHAYVDNLNLAYVAFTRAKEVLYVCAEKPKKDAVNNVSDLLYHCITNADNYPKKTQENQDIISLASCWNDEDCRFVYGTDWCTSTKDAALPEQEKMTFFSSVNVNERLHLRLYGKGFFNESVQRLKGNILHEILSNVHTLSDLPKAVQQQTLKGTISVDESLEITDMLQAALSSTKEAEDWFSGKYNIINEASILHGEGKLKRPDRVMLTQDEAIIIDYKFGEKEEKSYSGQLKDYARLIKEMGYVKVDAYIWYVSLGIVEEVRA